MCVLRPGPVVGFPHSGLDVVVGSVLNPPAETVFLAKVSAYLGRVSFHGVSDEVSQFTGFPLRRTSDDSGPFI